MCFQMVGLSWIVIEYMWFSSQRGEAVCPGCEKSGWLRLRLTFRRESVFPAFAGVGKTLVPVTAERKLFQKTNSGASNSRKKAVSKDIRP
jgi:hypothetical protein